MVLFSSFVIGLLGLCIGSFLNVLIDRLPNNKSVVKGRSHCDFCKHTLRWYELIPVVSFVFQGAKSRCCHKPLSFQYPLIELVTAVGFVLITNYQLPITNELQFFPSSFILNLLSYYVIFSSLLVIFVSDLKYEIIPLELIISGIIAALFLLILKCSHNFSLAINYELFTINYLLPSLVTAFFFFCLWFFSKGKAMGDGDISLSFLLGLIAGYPKIIIMLYAAFLTGAIAGVILMIGRKKSLKSHIPFGPFLIGGLVVSLVCGDTIISFWRFLW